MKIPIICTIIGIFFLISSKCNAQDSIQSKLKYSAVLNGDISNVGFYGGIGLHTNYKKLGFSLSYIIDYSKTELPVNGPFGFSFSMLYLPTLKEKTINHFINTDYRLVFHKRFCKYDCSKKYNKTHEVTVGYGILLKIFKNLSLSNSINIGFYVENAYSDRTSENIQIIDYNALVKTRLYYHF